MIVKIVCALILLLFVLATFNEIKIHETFSSRMQIVYAVNTIIYWQMLLLLIYKIVG